MKNSYGIIENYIGKLKEKEGEGFWGIVDKKRGKWAKTEWELLFSSKNFSLVRCLTHTGRTHQIRIHLSSIGYPLIGDLRYGGRSSAVFRPLLHAEKLDFIHPFTKKPLSIRAPLPEDFHPFYSSI